ncbi:MAG TPA: hypothetical protein VGZ28_09185 [Terriglobales bacterium]|jgi:hypothetical protein|nr:hypothetical protein [Terriglobales bacterium]
MKGKKAGSSERSADLNMAERNGLEQIVEKIVAQVLENHVPQLREELVRRVLDEVPQGAAAAEGNSGDGGAANLLKAVSAIQAGTTQREILRALLDNTVRYSGRGALFVVKAGAATGWQGRGFTKDGDDTIKDFALNVSSGLPEQALRSRMPFAGAASEVDQEFISHFGAPADDRALVLPLLLKEKVAAMVYADAGVEAGGKMDAAALELLVLATSAWLEVASLRKQAHKEETSEGTVEKAESAAPAAAAAARPDPFAAHAPKHFAAAASAVETTAVATDPPAAVVEAEPAAASAATAAAPALDAFAGLTPEDADVHRKAQRFARLLVDEIKLYNQAKVAEGRKNKDLYDRLKEDIEKSRGTYQKRYGNTVAGGADYFSQELIRSLAEDDSSIMGANFRRN